MTEFKTWVWFGATSAAPGNSNMNETKQCPTKRRIRRAHRNTAVRHLAERDSGGEVRQLILPRFHCEQFLPATAHSTETHTSPSPGKNSRGQTEQSNQSRNQSPITQRPGDFSTRKASSIPRLLNVSSLPNETVFWRSKDKNRQSVPEWKRKSEKMRHFWKTRRGASGCSHDSDEARSNPFSLFSVPTY